MGETFPIRLGTSGFSAEGWVGTFYPEKTQPKDYLRLYSSKLDAVEVDSTFYRTPTENTVRNWYEQTPEGFLFAAKVPQAITHEKCMDDCDDEMQRFVTVMSNLREKLGPLLLQFPYYAKKAGMTPIDFVGRLERFLPKLPQECRFALEIRNKTWIGPRLLDALRKHGVALARIDHPWMPRPSLMLGEEMTTAEFAYSRLLGDRYGIEERTKTWDKTVIDKSREIDEWAEVTKTLQKRVPVYTFVNNHFAGHAPATIRELKIRLGLETAMATSPR
jgi:uncharacterized protein YecE (DUF72 family)